MQEQQLTLDQTIALYIRSLAGRNTSSLTTLAYTTDLTQFISWIKENDTTVVSPVQIERAHITDYLSYLSDLGRSGVTRARKLAVIREYFKYLVETGILPASIAQNIKMPKKEKKSKTYLRPDEYNKLLAAAGGSPRDFAILQLFLQTGIRVSELIAITIDDLELEARTIKIHGKGNKERPVYLEKKSLQALKSYLERRPESVDPHLFLNYEGSGLSIRGVRKMVDKYLSAVGITKKISCHGLRHTFATNKAARGMNAYQLQKLMGHEKITTSQEYVHLGEADLRLAMERTSL